MKKKILRITLIIISLVLATLTIRFFLPVLLGFIDSNGQRIQTISNAVQIILWLAAGVWAALRWGWFGRSSASAPQKTNDNSAPQTVISEVYIANVEKQKITDPTRISEGTLRQAYLNQLYELSGQLSLAGIDPKAASQANSQLHLERVYTGLRTLTPEAHDQLQKPGIEERSLKYLSAVTLLNREPFLVLLGDPGSGKSTFVNFVTICLCGEALEKTEANIRQLTEPLPEGDEKSNKEKSSDKQPWEHPGLLPVRVILRDFAARGLPPAGTPATAQHLWVFIEAELAHKEYGPYLKKRMLKKGALMLFDGLDEVPEAHQRRKQIKEAILSFKSAYPNCRMLVTSRTYAYQKQDWQLPDFAVAVLAPFSKAQIHYFIDHWYAYIGELRGWHSDDYQGRAFILKNAIANNASLWELAERPLLLTLMASLHAWRGGSLPEKREELYDDTVDLLLDCWEQSRTARGTDGRPPVPQPSLAEYLKVNRSKMRQLLNQLAFEAHESQPDLNGTADIPEGSLVAGLMRISQNPEVGNPALLLRYLSERAGLLVPRGEGVYTFPHRSFQEYLAACHLTDTDFPDLIAGLSRNDPNRWREVLLLAAAKASRGATSTVWDIVDALCYKAADTAECDHSDLWGAHLAVQVLAEGANLSRVSPRHQERLEKVRHWASRLLVSEELPPSERAATGASLGVIGDPRREVLKVDAMPFCYVPGGPFMMGAGKEKHRNEYLGQGYWLARFPVSNAQFQAFVDDGGYGQAKFWPEAQAAKRWKDGKYRDLWTNEYRDAPQKFGAPFHLPNHPAVGVSWYEALAFSRWLSEHWRERGWLPEGWGIVLPSEAQWEKAARGGLEIPDAPLFTTPGAGWAVPEHTLIANSHPEREYPWGDKITEAYANYNATLVKATSTPGCFPGGRSSCGCEELSGNVWEWTRSIWGGYPYVPDDGRENFAGSEESARVVRGGGFGGYPVNLRCANRSYFHPLDHSPDLGFRVAAAP